MPKVFPSHRIGALILGAFPLWQTRPNRTPPCEPNNAGITLPSGFCATLFADSLGAARHLTVAANGDVIVNARPTRAANQSPGNPGGVFILRDADGDGKAEIRQRAADAAGTGIAIANGYVYATSGTSVLRYPYRAAALELGRRADTIIKDMPTGGHTAYNFVVDGSRLILNVGSRTNSCQERDRQNESKGVAPCTELETRAGIWIFSSEKPGQTATDGRRYATGIRNAVAMAKRAGDNNAVWVVQHGRDQLFQNWGKLFTERQSAENPAEELFRVAEGDDFGWPYCFYSNDEKKKVLAPEYGGDGKQVGRCAGKKGPIHPFPGHWAPNALLFYNGTAFPAQYRGGAFIAFHGSWNRAPLPQEGFSVAYLPMNGQRVTGEFTKFADGFAPPPPSPNEPARPVRRSRPTGLAEGPDGSLYVADDVQGKIWKISYRG
ncbi:MAG: PQQ-dependent sugar dehydrogenase [Gemmatimonadaceae bacterium]